MSASVREIIVTPEMVRAGLDELRDHSFSDEHGYILECIYRAMEYGQPTSDVDKDLSLAVARLKKALPGWWFSVGRCGLTCHASCGPDRAFIGQPFLDRYDSGFHADIPNPTTLAVALEAALAKALAALSQDAEWQACPSNAKGENGK